MLEWIQCYQDTQFLDAKWPVCLKKWFYFGKVIRKLCCIHSCLPICKNSESDVNLLMRYWQLKNTEIWSAESIFENQICPTYAVIKGHTYFLSTPFPYKTNEQVFLKTPKPHIRAISDNYFWKRIFPKKSGSHTHLQMVP